ncbi:MAG: response regulator transcription factor [Methylococcaceae bacterium]|nr:response regulator transcription factor [Methylococcaceae bacterium]
MDNLIIASTSKGQMRPWLEVLSPQYPLIFSNNLEKIFSEGEESLHDENILLIVDAKLLNETYQLPLLCKYFNKVIIVGEKFTSSQQIEFIYEGASGYSDKLIDKQLILRTVESVLNNEIWLKRQYIPQMLKEIVAKQSFAKKEEQSDNEINKTISILTQREREVVGHVYNGEENIVIAEQLNISDRTVKAHLSAIFRKLNVSGRFQLVVFLKDLQVSHRVSVENPS